MTFLKITIVFILIAYLCYTAETAGIETAARVVLGVALACAYLWLEYDC